MLDNYQEVPNISIVINIIETLCRANFEVFIVGGAVRDALLGKSICDYDIATNATADDIARLFPHYKTSFVGNIFKVTLVEDVEVATFRKDTYHGLSAKNCEVEIAKSIHEDLARRDLTMNSLAICPFSGNIIDECGGINDALKGIVRFTGDAEKRIYEDPCRIIRACRFKCSTQGEFNEDTFSALKKYAHYVKEHVSPERIALEIMKSMKYEKPSIFWRALHDIGALKYIFPEMEDCFCQDGGPFHGETVFDHMMAVGDAISSENKLLRLAGYLHDIGKPSAATEENGTMKFIGHEKVGVEIITKRLTKLKFPKKEIKYVGQLVGAHMRSFEAGFSSKAVRKFIADLQDKGINFDEWFTLRIADRAGNFGKADYTEEEIEHLKSLVNNELRSILCPIFCQKDLAINGSDIIDALSLNPGPCVGLILKNLLNMVIDDPALNDRQQLLRLAEEINC